MKKFILINTQFAIFFKEKVENPELVYEALNKELGSIFSLPAVINTLPNEQQLASIPVVRMTTKDNIFRLDIARARADFFVAGEGQEEFGKKKEVFVEKVKILFDFFKRSSEIKRIGFVTKFFVECLGLEEAEKFLLPSYIKLHGDSGKVSATDLYIRYSSKLLYDKYIEMNNGSSVERQKVLISGKLPQESF
jgi:hypothetical protein